MIYKVTLESSDNQTLEFNTFCDSEEIAKQKAKNYIIINGWESFNYRIVKIELIK